MIRLFLFFSLLLAPLGGFAQEQQSVDLVMFYGQGCPHCAKARVFLNELEEEYPTLNVQEFEVYQDQDNAVLFNELSAVKGQEVLGVPTIYIGEEVFVGYADELADNIRSAVDACTNQICESPLAVLDGRGNQTEDVEEELQESEDTSPVWKDQVTIPAIFTAAIVDAINPCAFAVLIILTTSILAAGSRRRALFAGLAFIFSIFISYYAMGLGLFSAIQAAGVTHTFYIAVAVLAILIGLFNLKDVLWYGKWFVMEVPMSWRPVMKKVIRGVTSVPGAFLIGFLISLFLLPCTSGPYIVVLGMLAEAATRQTALLLLALYNLVFILPMLIITLAIFFGFTSVEKAEAWRKKRIKLLHLIAGIIMLLLGIGMLIAVGLGSI